MDSVNYRLCCCTSVTQSCPVLCNPTDCSTPDFPVPHHFLEFAQTHVHWSQWCLPIIQQTMQYYSIYYWKISTFQLTHNGHELGRTSEDGEGQRGLACCSPWGCSESDMTGWLNNNNWSRREWKQIEVPLLTPWGDWGGLGWVLVGDCELLPNLRLRQDRWAPGYVFTNSILFTFPEEGGRWGPD